MPPVNPASSLCQESSFQLKFDYWFLILVPFFILMALLADSELPWVKIKYNRIANQAIRIRWQEEIYKLSDLGGLPTCLWEEFTWFPRGELCIGLIQILEIDTCRQPEGLSKWLQGLRSYTGSAGSLQEKSCPVCTHVPGDHYWMFCTLFSCKEVLRFNSQPPGPRGRHQISGIMNNVFSFLNLEGRWECTSSFFLMFNSEQR